MMQTFVRPSRDLRNHYAEISGIKIGQSCCKRVRANAAALFFCFFVSRWLNIGELG